MEAIFKSLPQGPLCTSHLTEVFFYPILLFTAIAVVWSLVMWCRKVTLITFLCLQPVITPLLHTHTGFHHDCRISGSNTNIGTNSILPLHLSCFLGEMQTLHQPCFLIQEKAQQLCNDALFLESGARIQVCWHAPQHSHIATPAPRPHNGQSLVPFDPFPECHHLLPVLWNSALSITNTFLFIWYPVLLNVKFSDLYRNSLSYNKKTQNKLWLLIIFIHTTVTDKWQKRK